MKFEQRVTEDRRLAILQALKAVYAESNESAVRIMLREKQIHVSSDQVRTDFAWLKENGLVELRDLAGVRFVKLTQRGIEAVDGDVTTPGVTNPTSES